MRCRMPCAAPNSRAVFAVTPGIASQNGQAFEDVEQVRLKFGGKRERVVGVALGLFRLTLCDRHPGARGQRPRPVNPAGRRGKSRSGWLPRSVSHTPPGSRSTTSGSVAPDSTV